MRKELQKQLKADYPTLFDSEEGCSCDIGDGWEPLFRRLCADIHHHETLRFVQIKEKFGGLRIYTTACDDEVYKRVHDAEGESFWTCEKCGQDGQLASSGGWIYTSCQDCLDMERANGRTCSWVKPQEES
ncbi:hypothetical protein C8R47DRAFT_157366 [Mycena vitilis]|nr:hypothetical protein C8R47DRAFT_157366 [Mycena vitilis]